MLVVCLLLFSSATRADEVLEASYEFNIQPQAVDLALTEFAEQADLTLVFPDTLVQDKQANALIGKYTLQEGVDVLLDGTGLTPQFSNEIVLSITTDEQSASGGRPMKSAKKAGLIAILAGALAGGANAQEPNAATEPAATTSEVRGKVTDQRTGANLKGALVEIEETGQSTSTNDLGEFRFPAVAEGEYTLRVSYLGYSEQSFDIAATNGRLVIENFEMVGAGVLEEITVYGYRSARALALNQERTAENFSTVLSSDLLGQFEGTTISESLRRAPGVAFQVDTETGDGQNVIVRGLAPDFNTVTLNGVRLSVGNGTDRSPALNNLLTDSVSKITISKTLLPNQDSTGTGGLIDIETKGPLDRPHQYAYFGIEAGRSSDDFLEEYLLSGTVSGTFGAGDNFGISASVQYRDRDVSTITYGVNTQLGEYLPLAENGVPITSRTQIDPRTPFPFELGVDDVYPVGLNSGFNGVSLSDLTITGSLQWRIGTQTNLRFDYTRAEQDKDTFFRVLTFNALSGYAPLPISELGGETRAALVWEDFNAVLPGLQVSASQQYTTRIGDTDTSSVYSLRGDSNLERFEFDYGLGYADGRSDSPNVMNLGLGLMGGVSGFVGLDPSFLAPEALENMINGRMISPFARREAGVSGYPLPLLTSDGFDYFNDPSKYQLSGGFLDGRLGRNERYSGDFSARYNFDNEHIKYVEGGVFYESSEPSSVNTLGLTTVSPVDGVGIDSLGLAFEDQDLSAIGIDNGFMVIQPSDLFDFANDVENLASGPNPLIMLTENDPDPLIFETYTKEEELSAYLQAHLEFGRFEIIGGARFVRVDSSAVNINSPTILDENGVIDVDFFFANRAVVELASRQDDILPRVLMNYRWSDNLIFRAGYFLTVARPAISQLSSSRTISLDQRPIHGPENNLQLLQIFEGNPGLRPAFTDNFDLSVEYYDNSIGVMKASIFYKSIDNIIFNNTTQSFRTLEGVVLPDDPRFQSLNENNVFVQGFRPENSPDDSYIWGVEAAFERQFTFLPGFLDGFGVFANYTYTESSKTEIRPYFDSEIGSVVDVVFEDVPFPSQPKHSGTAAITYNKYGIDTTLAYTTQSRNLTTFLNHNLHNYQERISSLDLRAEYRLARFDADWRVYFEVSDLLKNASDPDLERSIGGIGITPKVINSATYIGGRTFRLGVAASF